MRVLADSIFLDAVAEAYHRGLDFILGQVQEGSPGWGQSPGTSPDPWTTSQLVIELRSQTAVPTSLIERSVGWLEDCQNLDGSWGSSAYGRQGDTPATALATICLLDYFGQESIAAQKGLKWLRDTYNGGWTTLPTTEKQPYQSCHLYSSAQALRALSRGPRHHIASLCVQEGLIQLRRARCPRKGWGFQADSPSDATFTAYVLHALYDVNRIWGLEIPISDVEESLAWLMAVQNDDGSWAEWHGVQRSPEAAAYSIYSIVVSGLVLPGDALLRASEWLLQVQRPDGGWSLDAEHPAEASNWVTYTVLFGLKAFWLHEALGLSNPRTGLSDRRSASGSILSAINLDGRELPESAIAIGEDGPFRGDFLPSYVDEAFDVPTLYSVHAAQQWRHVPVSRPLDHTMYRAIDAYVDDKIPATVINNVLERGGWIEVHGVYPTHLAALGATLGLHNIREADGDRKPTTKRFNRIRPGFFLADRAGRGPVLVCATIPGIDYFHHYASMLRHYALSLTSRAEESIHLIRYPSAERSLPSWTGLGQTLVKPGDRVVIGYVEALENQLSGRDGIELLGQESTQFYESTRFRLRNGSVINLLGVRFCFWGSICHHIAYRICSLGCSELLYLGKLGALTGPEDIYQRIFCPSHFILLDHDQVVYVTTSPKNGLLGRYPALDSGCHVSVPTVLEEDYAQRRIAMDRRANSIDNEISQVARAVFLYNSGSQGGAVAFSALHLATDYIRHPDERDLEVPFDLGNDKSDRAREKKALVLHRIIDEYLIPYLESTQ